MSKKCSKSSGDTVEDMKAQARKRANHTKKVLLYFTAILFTVSLAAYFHMKKSVSLEHFPDNQGISGSLIYQYQYAKKGELALFQDQLTDRLIAADISVVDIPFLPGFLDPVGVRASYRCDIATGKWQKLHQFSQSILNDPCFPS